MFHGFLLTVIACLSSCIEFKISDEEAKEALNESSADIHFANLQVDGRNMHYAYTKGGKEALVVFVHGSPGSWSAFIDYFKADSLLKKVDFLAVDRAGFGNSGYGTAEPSIEKQAMQIKEVTDQFAHARKILIGHSLGGPVIARMAMDYPQDFDGLVLVAPSIDPAMEKDEWYRKLIKTKVGGAFTPKEFEVSNDEILPLKEELELMLPLWKRIQIPTILIQGTKDKLVPKENADFAIKMMPDSLLDVRLLEGVNHFIPWGQSEEITKAIQQLNGF